MAAAASFPPVPPPPFAVAGRQTPKVPGGYGDGLGVGGYSPRNGEEGLIPVVYQKDLYKTPFRCTTCDSRKFKITCEEMNTERNHEVTVWRPVKLKG